MKRIILLIFLMAAVWLGVKLAQDPGYILIAYQRWTIEMPLWLGIALITLIFLALYGIFRFLYHLKRTGKYYQFWSRKMRKQRAIEKTYGGFLDIVNGRFKSGEKKLSRAASDSPLSLINYLTAAQAAFFQKAYVRSERYLNQALEKEPEAAVAIGITKATLEVEAQAWKDALATLKPLDLQAPHNSNVIMLLKVVYQNLHMWKDLIDLLPRLKKSSLENKESIRHIEHQAYLEWLKNSSVDTSWSMIPRHLKQDPMLIYAYAEKLISQNHSREAEFILRKYLKHQWSESLIELYGNIVTDRPAEQLRFIEQFLQKFPQNAQLLLCLGKLAMNARLWGKAKHYIEISIKQAPCVESYEILGKVLELLGEKEAAFAIYRQAVSAGK